MGRRFESFRAHKSFGSPCWREVPRFASGFRPSTSLRAGSAGSRPRLPRGLTPARRLKFESFLAHQETPSAESCRHKSGATRASGEARQKFAPPRSLGPIARAAGQGDAVLERHLVRVLAEVEDISRNDGCAGVRKQSDRLAGRRRWRIPGPVGAVVLVVDLVTGSGKRAVAPGDAVD